MEAFSQRLRKPSKANFPKPSEWLQKHFLIPEPRDPITGEYFEPGPIRLRDVQCRIVDEALSRTENGLYRYTTVIYSTIKKSGKSALSSGVGLFVGEHHPYGHIYCLANDGKQSNDRLFGPIYTCLQLHNRLGGMYKGVRSNLTEVTLPNSAKIESLPCDAAGEAGAEPTLTLWSELWGFDTEAKRRLWSEMTIPPTKFGRSIRWVETYAGYMGVSDLLWGLYEQAVLQGQPHPDFMDLTSDGDPVVWVNEAAGIFCYWDHEPRMAWQLGNEGQRYYQQEAKILLPSENRRIHHNEWIAPVGSFIQPEWWDACQNREIGPLLDPTVPVAVAVDAAETNDCAALVAVTRHPLRPETDIAIRACRIFKPSGPTGTILLEPTVGLTLLEWGLRWNIVVVGYDAYQMAKLVQDYRRGHITVDPDQFARLAREIGSEATEETMNRFRKAIQRWYCKFSQQNQRAVADKQLYDLITHRRIEWNPNDQDWDIAPRGDTETLTKHIKQAGAGQTKGQYRLQKLSNNMKIDGAVALSMASDLCLRLNLTNFELSPAASQELLTKGEISYDEYVRRLAGSRQR